MLLVPSLEALLSVLTAVCSSQDSEQKDYINVKGCVPQFEKWLQDNLTLVAGIFIGVALLQVSSTVDLHVPSSPSTPRQDE